MDFIKSCSFVLLFASLSSVCLSLELERTLNGPCFEAQPDPSFDLTWFAASNWRYFVAGSQYALYSIVLGHPDFPRLREFEFYYNSCIHIRNMNFTSGSLELWSFGGQAWSRNTNLQFVAPGVFDLTFQPLPRPGLPSQVVRHWITLTDNESFVFMHNCLNGTERGFSVISTRATLSPQALKRIEDHAIALGHHRQNVVLLRRETCNDSTIPTPTPPTSPTPTPKPTPPPRPTKPTWYGGYQNPWAQGRQHFFHG